MCVRWGARPLALPGVQFNGWEAYEDQERERGESLWVWSSWLQLGCQANIRRFETGVESPGRLGKVYYFLKVCDVHYPRWALIEGIKELSSKSCPLWTYTYKHARDYFVCKLYKHVRARFWLDTVSLNTVCTKQARYVFILYLNT